MQGRLGRAYAAVAVIAIAIALLIVSGAGVVISSSTDFSIYNTGWNGTSDLATATFELGKFAPSFRIASTGTDISISNLGLDEIDLNPLTSALIVIGPTKTFSNAEQGLVGNFLRDGGTLLLADDFGTGNDLLEGINATTRFSGMPVMDLAFEKQPDFSVCFDIRSNELTRNVSTLLLNHPSSLTGTSSSLDILAYSSVASWLDTNGDGVQEWNEPRGPFPLMAIERLGAGSIILLSDPSVLINGMLGFRDNRVLAENLLTSLSEGRVSVYFDESHRDYFNPVDITTKFMGAISVQGKVLIALLVLLVALWVTTDLLESAFTRVSRMLRNLGRALMTLLPARFSRSRRSAVQPPRTADELVADAMKNHPDWKVGMVRYIVRERERNKSWSEKKGSG